MVVIEVCQGPDCISGGAALLEIEELVQEKQSKENIRLCLVEGGCRRFCSVGPNVHITDVIDGNIIDSVEHVSDASKCELAVQKATKLEARMDKTKDSQEFLDQSIPSTSSVGLHQSMMARRAARIRWETLRTVSRRLAKCKKDVNNDPDILNDQEKCKRKINLLKEDILDALNKSSDAEISASRSVAIRDRAVRRRERLAINISSRLERCFEEEQSEGSDDESSEEK